MGRGLRGCGWGAVERLQSPRGGAGVGAIAAYGAREAGDGGVREVLGQAVERVS